MACRDAFGVIEFVGTYLYNNYTLTRRTTTEHQNTFMKHLHEIIEVPAEITDAFRYVADFGRISEWDPGVTESARLTPGPVGEGSRFRVLVRAGLGHTEMEYAITAFEPPYRVVLEGSGETIHAVDEIRFSRSGDQTRIDYTADIRLGGAAGAIEPLLGPLLERDRKSVV